MSYDKTGVCVFVCVCVSVCLSVLVLFCVESTRKSAVLSESGGLNCVRVCEGKRELQRTQRHRNTELCGYQRKINCYETCCVPVV